MISLYINKALRGESMKKIITTVLSIFITVLILLGASSNIKYFSRKETVAKPIKNKWDIVTLLVEEYNEQSKFYNKKYVEEEKQYETNYNNMNNVEKSPSGQENNLNNEENLNEKTVIAGSNNTSNEKVEKTASVAIDEEEPVIEVSKEPISDNFFENIEGIIFQRVNEERTKEGLPALKYSNTMRKYARIKSMDMGDRGYFEHRDPEGRLMSDIIKKDGISYKAWGENIAYIGGMTDEVAIAERFVSNWMKSPSHRDNILCDKFEEIGIGVYKIGNRFYASQEFFK